MKESLIFAALGLVAVAAACSGDTEGGGGSGGAAGATGGSGGASGSGGGAGSGGLAGSGGTSGSAGTAGTAGAGGSSGAAGGGGAPGDGGLCATLNSARAEALAAAIKCSGVLGVVQCSGSATVPDQCACPTLVNEAQPDKVKAAQDAYDAWVKAGCGPYPCGAACFAGSTGTCDGVTGICKWE